MALAHKGAISTASPMPPRRLLRAHRHAWELIISLRAADQARGLPFAGLFRVPRLLFW